MEFVPEKVVLHHDGKELECKLTTNGLCAVEAAFSGQSLESIGKDLGSNRGGIKAARALFRAVLLDQMPALTEVEAGRLLQAVGAEEATRVIQASFDQLKAGMGGVAVDLPECNPKGELAFEVAGVRYVLSFGFNAQAELEDVFPGKDMVGIARELANGAGVAQIRAMFRAAFLDFREVSLHETGGIMDQIGIATASAAVGKAFVGSFPKAAAADDEDEATPVNRKRRRAAAATGGKNPTKVPRKGGTGKP